VSVGHASHHHGDKIIIFIKIVPGFMLDAETGGAGRSKPTLEAASAPRYTWKLEGWVLCLPLSDLTIGQICRNGLAFA
jgi:hypothetical protein